MKKFMVVVTMVLLLVCTTTAGTLTPNFNLYKPAIKENNWGLLVNNNWNMIDAALSSLTSSITYDKGVISGLSSSVGTLRNDVDGLLFFSVESGTPVLDLLVGGYPYWDLRSRPTITEVDALAVETGRGIVCASTQAISTALEINSHLRAIKGCIISHGTNTVILNGSLDADENPFVGTGPVIVGSYTARIGRSYYRNGQIVEGVTQDLPETANTIEVNSYDNPPESSAARFNFVSQMWSGVTPSPSREWLPNEPHNILLAGSFTAHRGGNSNKFLTALNPMISSEPRPKGFVDTNGTLVTRVSGSTFLTGTGWTGSLIAINNVGYLISSVTDADHLVLLTSAGTQTNVVWSGGGGIGVEIDINTGDDETATDPLGTTALAVASGGWGGKHHTYTGISINGAFGPGSEFQNGLIIGPTASKGMYILPPDNTNHPTAGGMDVSNGESGGSVIKYGSTPLTVTGGTNGIDVYNGSGVSFIHSGGTGTATALVIDGTDALALRMTPLTDGGEYDESPFFYITDSLNSSIPAYITKSGHGVFSAVTTTNITVTNGLFSQITVSFDGVSVLYGANQIKSNGGHFFINYDGGQDVSINTTAGNVLIGTDTDDGVNKLQVNGSISASGGYAGILTGVTNTFGGGLLASAGTCTSGTATVSGATTTMGVIAQPSDGVHESGIAVYAYVSGSNAVTVDQCAIVAVTPAARYYHVKVVNK